MIVRIAAQHTPLPESKASGEDERSVLLGYLTFHRVVLARKVEGLTDEEGRRAVFPSSALSLLGIIRHMTDVERWWFRRVQQAEDVPGIFDEEEEWRVPDDATVADSLRAYWDEIAVVDTFLAGADMDHLDENPADGSAHTLRRLIVHMIEEPARHCGHADLLREAIDGTTGD